MLTGDIPSWLERLITGFGTALSAAWVGRMMWHIRAVQMGKRKFWSLHLLWEVPVAIGMALIADGIAEWIGLTGKTTIALIAAVSYLGPHGIEAAMSKLLDRRELKG
jgi:Na+/glutamate symporter